MLKRSLFAAAVLLFLTGSVGANQRKSGEASARATTQLRLTQCALKVHGMVCNNCARGVKQRLLKLDGVKSAALDYKTGVFQVQYEPNKTNPEKIVEAFNQGISGFRAELANAKGK